MKNITLTAAFLSLSVAVFAQDVMQPTAPKKPILQMTDDDVSPAVKLAPKETLKAETGKPSRQQSNVAIPEDRSESANVENADPMEIINESLRKLSLINSYRVQMKMTGMGEGTQNLFIAEVLNPDRTYINAGTTEELQIGSKFWKKGSSGQWSVNDGNKLSIKDFYRLMFNDLQNSSISKSDEKLGKVVVTVFVFTSSEKIGEGFPFTKIWIGKNDGLPYMFEAGNTIGGMKTVCQFYDFNAPMKINPPKL